MTGVLAETLGSAVSFLLSFPFPVFPVSPHALQTPYMGGQLHPRATPHRSMCAPVPTVTSLRVFLCTCTTKLALFSHRPIILLCLPFPSVFLLSRLFYSLCTFVDRLKSSPRERSGQISKTQKSSWKGSVQPSVRKQEQCFSPLISY